MRQQTWMVSFGVLAIVAAAGCSRSTTAEAEPAATKAAEPAKVAAAAPRSITIDAGTPLKVRTTSTLSTKSVESGATFTATLAEPLIDGDVVLAKKGAAISGIVAESDDGGRVKGVAQISVRLTRIELANGKTVDVQTNTIVRAARTTKKRDAAKVGIASGAGAIIGAIAGGGKGAAIGAAAGAGAGGGYVVATHGEPAVIGSESVLTFKLRNPVTIERL